MPGLAEVSLTALVIAIGQVCQDMFKAIAGIPKSKTKVRQYFIWGISV